MSDSGFKTPDPKMAGFITLVLLLLFAFSYVVPVLNVSWIRAGAEFDAALQQNLLLLLVLSVGYYIGTTKASEDKNETIRTQATTAATVAAAVAPAVNQLAAAGVPTGKVDDPVIVKVVPDDPGFAAFRDMVLAMNPGASDQAIIDAWAALKSKVDVQL